MGEVNQNSMKANQNFPHCLKFWSDNIEFSLGVYKVDFGFISDYKKTQLQLE